MRNPRLTPISLLLAIGLIVCLSFVGFAGSPAKAQGGPFTYTFDFTVNDGGWVAEPATGAAFGAATFGHWVASTGWVQDCAQFNSGGAWSAYEVVQVSVSVGSSFTFTGVTATFDRTIGTYSPGNIDFVWHDTTAPGNRVVTADPNASGSNQTLTWTGSVTGVSSLGIALLDGYALDPSTGSGTNHCPLGGSIVLKSIVITGTDNPFPTQTPTPTPTALPDSGFSGTPLSFPDCPLLGLDNATFKNLNAGGGWNGTDDLAHPTGQTAALAFPFGHATLPLSLSRFHQYSIVVKFHITDVGDGATEFRVKMGQSPELVVTVAATSSDQQFEVPAANYIPDQSQGNTDLFDFQFVKAEVVLEGGNNQSLIIDYACVTDGTPPGSEGVLGNTGLSLFVDAQTCRSCSYSLQGDLLQDLPGSIDWLLCGLAQLIECTLIPFLFGMLMSISKLIYQGLEQLAFFRQWLELTMVGVNTWSGSTATNMGGYLGGHFRNVVAGLGNNATVSTNFPDVANNFFSAVAGFISAGFAAVGAIFQFIATTLVSIITRGIQMLQVFISIVSIALAAPATIPPGVPACDTTASMIPASCVPIFMIDNTVLADSGFVWPTWGLIQGAVGLGLVVWAIVHVRNSLSGEADETE